MAQWAAALERTGRPIWFELSFNLDFAYASFWKAHANGWRVTGDIEDTGRLTAWKHVRARFDAAARWAPFAGPGGWNDLDSLEVGNGEMDGITLDERRTMMTLWAIAGSPLFLGADLTNLDPTDLAMLVNTEVLAVDQAGHVGTPLVAGATTQVWRAANPDASFTVALFNLGDEPSAVTVTWSELGIPPVAAVRDLWARRDLGVFQGGYQVVLPGHGSALLRVHS